MWRRRSYLTPQMIRTRTTLFHSYAAFRMKTRILQGQCKKALRFSSHAHFSSRSQKHIAIATKREPASVRKPKCSASGTHGEISVSCTKTTRCEAASCARKWRGALESPEDLEIHQVDKESRSELQDTRWADRARHAGRHTRSLRGEPITLKPRN